MKASRALQVLTVAMWLPLLSGCFTAAVTQHTVKDKADWFAPTAIYRSKAGGSVAVGGTLVKAGDRDGQPAYLIVPQKVLVAAHLETKGDVSMGDISSLPPQVRRGLHLQETLDANYEKTGDVLKGDGGMSVNQRKTVNIKAAGMLPFAFAVDAATFPLEIYLVKKLRENPIN